MFVEVNNNKNVNLLNNNLNKGLWLVWFFADWCGHCKTMVPEWSNLKKNNCHSLNLAKVRDDYVSQINNDTPVQGYPTIILYKNGELVGIHNGERTSDSFNDYVKNNISTKELLLNKNQHNAESKGITNHNNSGFENNIHNTSNSLKKKRKTKRRKKSASINKKQKKKKSVKRSKSK